MTVLYNNSMICKAGKVKATKKDNEYIELV